MRRIAVLGGGAWGTALANLAARGGADVALWARDPAHAAEMAATGVNARRLPGIPFVPGVTPTSDLAAALDGAATVLLVAPAQSIRALAERAKPHLAAAVPVVICAKGIERGTGLFMSEVLSEVLPGNPAAILSGPSFAEDVARGLPTAVTIAARGGAAAELAGTLATPTFRLYHSADIRGVEIGGAAKNVLAIASGIAAGKGFGASAAAALLARGFAELVRFGAAYGAQPATLAGLSGLGDLVLTCGSRQSRNFSLGAALGEGLTLEAARTRVGTAEGAFTCSVLCTLADAAAIDMPIARAVEDVLTGRADVDATIEALLTRPPRADAAF